MSNRRHLRVTSAFLAVEMTGHHDFTLIPKGAVIETPADLLDSGLNSVRMNGVDLLAYSRDLKERTQDDENDTA